MAAVPAFEPGLHMAPVELFGLLDGPEAPVLVELAPAASGASFSAALPWPGSDWRPAKSGPRVVFVDGDGRTAAEVVRRLQEEGFPRIRALYGGIDLYVSSLDSEVVGPERHLRT